MSIAHHLLTALMLALSLALPAWAQTAAADEPAPEQVLDAASLKLLSNAPRIAVAGFRVAFITKNSISASSRAAFSNLGGGNTVRQAANAHIEVELQNIDDARMQAITEQAYADFMAALQATGRPLVPLAEMQAATGWQQLEMSPQDKPYSTSPVGTKKHYTFVAPKALPLWFGHFDAPLGDKAPFSLGNWRALNQLSVDTGAVVIVPQVVVDFAQLEGSGNSMWRTSAEVGAKSAMSIEPGNTRLLVFHARIALAGELGAAALKQGLPLPGAFGEFVDVTDESTRTAQAVGNTLSNMLTMLSGTQGTVRSTQKQALKADAEAYQALASAGAKRIGALYARALAQGR